MTFAWVLPQLPIYSIQRRTFPNIHCRKLWCTDGTIHRSPCSWCRRTADVVRFRICRTLSCTPSLCVMLGSLLDCKSCAQTLSPIFWHTNWTVTNNRCTNLLRFHAHKTPQNCQTVSCFCCCYCRARKKPKISALFLGTENGWFSCNFPPITAWECKRSKNK